MQSIHVIRRPLLTEKTTFGMNERSQYAFEVDRRATKTDVKRAIEDLYKVHVISVNTLVRKGTVKRLRTGYTTTPEVKRAIVRLREGEVIELL
jgi:large subunit ribosomal protein L23